MLSPHHVIIVTQLPLAEQGGGAWDVSRITCPALHEDNPVIQEAINYGR